MRTPSSRWAVGAALCALAQLPRAAPLTQEEYVALQLGKTDNTIGRDGTIPWQWVFEAEIEVVALFAKTRLPLANQFALCHGTRSGREVLWFRKHLPRMQAWGTELSPKVAALSPWTIAQDFHDVRPEWRGAADFVYSNSLDHSYNATHALAQWMVEVAPGGALFVHWTSLNWSRRGKPSQDLFTATDQELHHIVRQAGFAVVDVIRFNLYNRTNGADWQHRHLFVIARHGEQAKRPWRPPPYEGALLAPNGDPQASPDSILRGGHHEHE
jgi:hypothetical protein